MNIWKITKEYTAFLFMGHMFWKERMEDGVKLLESNILNCCIKKKMANLLKIFRERPFRGLSSKISQQGPSHVPHSTTPLPPH